MHKMKILLVDDREANLIALECVLQHFEADLVTANCGKVAIQQALQHEFALILMDVMMPQMDGYQCATLLRSLKLSKHTPIIFITAADRDKNYVFKGYQSGAVDFLYKPYDAIILKSKVEVFLDLYNQKLTLKESNRARELLNRQLEEANEKLQEFVGIVSHDLRSPLASIFNMSEVLIRGHMDAEKNAKFITMIHDTSNRGLNLVKELLSLTAFGTGKVNLNIARVDTASLIQQAVAETYLQAESKGLGIVANYQNQLFIQADQHRLMQVLINLITNAVKFSPSGSKVEVGCKIFDEKVKLWVKDSGIGIPADLQPKLFDKSQKCSRPGTAGEEGTGFGLPLSQEIIELHGSSINVQSEENAGSCFYFLLENADSSNQARLSALKKLD